MWIEKVQPLYLCLFMFERQGAGFSLATTFVPSILKQYTCVLLIKIELSFSEVFIVKFIEGSKYSHKRHVAVFLTFTLHEDLGTVDIPSAVVSAQQPQDHHLLAKQVCNALSVK